MFGCLLYYIDEVKVFIFWMVCYVVFDEVDRFLEMGFVD